MRELVSATTEQLHALEGVELAVFDVDNTLVFADDPSFYSQYGSAVEVAIAQHYNTSPEEAAQIASTYRSSYGGGEQALFRGDVHTRYPHVAQQQPNASILFTELCKIDPAGHFAKQTAIKAGIAALRDMGIKTVALTSSPEPLSRQILAEAGFDPNVDFDDYITYSPTELPPKMDPSRQIFAEVAQTFGIQGNQVLAVGDSLRHDILPALNLGMLACLIQEEVPENYEGMVASSTLDIITELHAARARRLGLPVSGDEVCWRD